MRQKINNNHDGEITVDPDLVDLRSIELALANPRSGSPAALELEKLAAATLRHDELLLISMMQPSTGALCFCKKYCYGADCVCWCHPEGWP
jgi:hypothetical protein